MKARHDLCFKNDFGQVTTAQCRSPNFNHSPANILYKGVNRLRLICVDVATPHNLTKIGIAVLNHMILKAKAHTTRNNTFIESLL